MEIASMLKDCMEWGRLYVTFNSTLVPQHTLYLCTKKSHTPTAWCKLDTEGTCIQTRLRPQHTLFLQGCMIVQHTFTVIVVGELVAWRTVAEVATISIETPCQSFTAVQARFLTLIDVCNLKYKHWYCIIGQERFAEFY